MSRSINAKLLALYGTRRHAPVPTETLANVNTTDLFAHFTFETFTDHGSNGTPLSVKQGTPIGFTADGYRLDGDAELIAAFSAGAWLPHHEITLQVVLIPHTVTQYSGYQKLQVQDFAIQSEGRFQLGARDIAQNIGSLIVTDAGATDELKSTTTWDVGAAQMITARWGGSGGGATTRDLFKNKTIIISDGRSGDISPDEVVFSSGTGGDATIVYATVYKRSLTDAEVESNYNEIRTVVNNRPGVNLPA